MKLSSGSNRHLAPWRSWAIGTLGCYLPAFHGATLKLFGGCSASGCGGARCRGRAPDRVRSFLAPPRAPGVPKTSTKVLSRLAPMLGPTEMFEPIPCQRQAVSASTHRRHCRGLRGDCRRPAVKQIHESRAEGPISVTCRIFYAHVRTRRTPECCAVARSTRASSIAAERGLRRILNNLSPAVDAGHCPPGPCQQWRNLQHGAVKFGRPSIQRYGRCGRLHRLQAPPPAQPLAWRTNRGRSASDS